MCLSKFQSGNVLYWLHLHMNSVQAKHYSSLKKSTWCSYLNYKFFGALLFFFRLRPLANRQINEIGYLLVYMCVYMAGTSDVSFSLISSSSSFVVYSYTVLISHGLSSWKYLDTALIKRDAWLICFLKQLCLLHIFCFWVWLKTFSSYRVSVTVILHGDRTCK